MTEHHPIGSAINRRQTRSVEGSTMIILERDGSLSNYPPQTGRQRRAQATPYVTSPESLPPTSTSLLERVISKAFDTLKVHWLEVRIDESES